MINHGEHRGHGGNMEQKTYIKLIDADHFVFIIMTFMMIVQCATVMGNESNPADDGSLDFSNMCQYKPPEYIDLFKEIDKQYPDGSDAGPLMEKLRANFELVWEKQTVDPVKLTKESSGKVDWKNVKPNSMGYAFRKTCPERNGNVMKWSIVLLADLNNMILGKELRPLLDDDWNFALRGIPFAFEYFSNAKSMQKVLWDLTGTGSSKLKVMMLMSKSMGIYGRLKEPEIYKKDNKIIYRYRMPIETSLSSRIAIYEFGSVVVWKFEEQDKLIKLDVN